MVTGNAHVSLWRTYVRHFFLHKPGFNPDFAVGIVARRSKPQRNAQLERFCDAGIIIIMLRSKIVKQALQQGFASRSRWLLQILGL
jgi:hypothetical protein